MKGRPYRFFLEQNCDLCGDCFVACPYLELPREESVKAIRALIDREGERPRALDLCNTCHTCQVVCSRHADPYALVLERWGEERAGGMPATSRLVMPSQEANIWSCLGAIIDEDERALLERWDDFGPCEEICLAGFYTNIVPHVYQAGVLQGMPRMVGSEALWGCAGDIYKTGRFDLVEQITRRLERVFADMGVKKVVCSMSAEAMMLSEVLPQRFGATFGFDVDSLDAWLLRRLQSGEVPLPRSLGLRVTIHDNCLSKLHGGELQEINREIVRRTGCDIVEMEHNRERALCCGFGAAAANFRVMDIMESGYRRLQEIESTGVDAAVVYCPACLFILSVIKEMANSHIQLYHPVELVEMAAGGQPLRRHDQRAWDVAAVISNHLVKYALLPGYRKDFQPPPVTENMEPGPALPRGDFWRMKALAALFHGPLVQNRLARTLLARGFGAAVGSYDFIRRKRLAGRP